MDKVAVLIPCYNEEKTIGKVVKDWKKELPKYRGFETQCTNYHTQSPMWSDYEILFIAIILTVCYNDSHWDKKAVWLFVPTIRQKIK